MSPPAPSSWSRNPRRGSVLLTALLLATVIGIGLASYIGLSQRTVELAQRTFYLNDAANLAEAGLEEATFAFNLTNDGTAAATAWSAWTLSGTTAKLTLPTFTCSQNAVGIVKVYIAGYDGSIANASITSQAVVTPLDGTQPVVRTLKVSMSKKGMYDNAIVGANEVSIGSHATVDSFNSNPSGAAGAAHLAYPGTGAGSNGNLVALSGKMSLGSSAVVNGSIMLGSGVARPNSGRVTGDVVTNYSATYTLPTYPTLAGVSRGYTLTSVPTTLPRSGDLPAADGRYYYFGSDLVIRYTTITAGKDVTIVGSGNSVFDKGVTVRSGATLYAYITGEVSTSNSDPTVNENWAGALQVYTSTNKTVELAHNGTFLAAVYAPFAKVNLNGGGSSPQFIGALVAGTIRTSSNIAFHFDEALRTIPAVGGGGQKVSSWYDLAGTTELSGLAASTGGFLR